MGENVKALKEELYEICNVLFLGFFYLWTAGEEGRKDVFQSFQSRITPSRSVSTS